MTLKFPLIGKGRSTLTCQVARRERLEGLVGLRSSDSRDTTPDVHGDAVLSPRRLDTHNRQQPVALKFAICSDVMPWMTPKHVEVVDCRLRRCGTERIVDGRTVRISRTERQIG
jgi:hypothetical protein